MTYLKISMVLFLLLFTTLSTSASKALPPLSKIANTAEKIASTYNKMGWFSGSVLVTKNGNTIFSQAYGYRDLSLNSKNTLKTKYNLGSIAKNFTKVLVLQQIQAGRLQIDDTLDKFDIGFSSEIATKVTIRHLLDHRSGFADIFVATYRENQLSFDTIESKIQILIDKPLLFQPGTERKYSNYGYIVLGAVLERITGSSYNDLLISKIFKPLDIQSTSLQVNTEDPNQSERYTYQYDGSLKYVGMTEHPSPDGGIEANVKPVQTFYRALFYGSKLLNRQLPFVRETFSMDGEHWGSYGGGLGVNAAAEIDLEKSFEIIVLANTDSLVAEYISTRIMSYINNGTYQKITPRPINFAYDFYKNQGEKQFLIDFKDHYKAHGYQQFTGRTINELAMELLKSGEKKRRLISFST